MVGQKAERRIGFQVNRTNIHTAELNARVQSIVNIDKLKKTLMNATMRQKERHAPKPLLEFLIETAKPSEVEGKPFSFEYIPAAGAIRQAIEHKGVINHDWATEYPFFSDRTDKHQVVGNEDVLEEVVEFLTAHEKGTESRSKILLIIGKPGSGKSTVVDALKAGYEEYSQTSTTPIYGLSGCPINENPLHILHTLANGEFQGQLPQHGDLCPHCKERLRKDLQSDPTRFEIEALDISSAEGIGITKLEHDMTVHLPPEAVRSLISASNRGILEIAEYSKHPDGFRRMLGELISTGILQDVYQNPKTGEAKRREYNMDHVVIATTTLEEWETLRARLEKEFPGELRRIKEIYWPFVTARKDEIAIYKKSVGLSDYNPHLSPQVLDVLARVALRTRLKTVPHKKKDKTLQVGSEEKLELYDGKETPELTQRDRRAIQKASREAKEGMDGLPPTFMTEVIATVMAANPECLTPLDVLRECEEFVRKNPAKLPSELKDKSSELIKSIANAKAEYELWRLGTVRKALRVDYEGDVERLFQEYLDNLGLLALANRERRSTSTNGSDIFDEEAQKKKPNILLMHQIEDGFQDNMTDAQRETFRQDVNNVLAAIGRNRGIVFCLESFPKLKKGIESKIGGDDDKKLLDMFTTDAPAKELLDERAEVRRRLIEQYGFCDQCVDDNIALTQHQLRSLPDQVKKVS